MKSKKAWLFLGALLAISVGVDFISGYQHEHSILEGIIFVFLGFFVLGIIILIAKPTKPRNNSRDHMNEQIAYEVARAEIGTLEQMSYMDLKKLMGHRQTKSVEGVDGKMYNIEIQAFWDNKSSGNLRVIVAVDDGGLSAFRRPHTETLIMTP